MPLLQQSFIRKTNATMSKLQDYLKEKEKKPLDIDTTVYNQVHNMLKTNNLLTKPFDFIYDYYFFTFMQTTEDVAPKMKKLFKDINISYENILSNMSCINACIIHTYEYTSDIKGITLAKIEFLKSYVLYLGYLLDLLYPNKKITIGGKTYKFKDLEERRFKLNSVPKETTSLITKIVNDIIAQDPSNTISNGITKIIDDTLAIDDHKGITKGDSLKNFLNLDKKQLKGSGSRKTELLNLLHHLTCKQGEIELSNSAIYKRKYTTIQIDYLMRTLLPDSAPYYLKRYSEQLVTILNTMEEKEEDEYNLELTTEFYQLLRRRAYLLPRNGVSIETELAVTLDLYERHHKGEHYLIIVNNIFEFSLPTIINLTKEYVVHSGKWLYDICNYLYYFYKLDEQAEILLDSYYPKSPRFYVSYDIAFMIEKPKKIIQGTAKEIYSSFDVMIPYYWRYRNNLKTNKINVNTFRDNLVEPSEIFISAYKRKLPKGQKASKEAREDAKRYEIELEDNETLVRPFTRLTKSIV